MQAKKHSVVEVIVSTAVGFFVTLIAQSILFPVYGIVVSTATNLQVVAWMTAISVARGFVLRRIFNRFTG